MWQNVHCVLSLRLEYRKWWISVGELSWSETGCRLPPPHPQHLRESPALPFSSQPDPYPSPCASPSPSTAVFVYPAQWFQFSVYVPMRKNKIRSGRRVMGTGVGHPSYCSCSSFILLLLSRFSRVRLCATPETAAHQAPLSLRFSRQEHWSGLPFPSLMHKNEKWKWSCSVVSDS